MAGRGKAIIKIELTGRLNLPVSSELETDFITAFRCSGMSSKSEFARMVLREGLENARAHGIVVKC